MIISDRVRSRMEAVGLTQTKLARRVNVTQGAIAKIANNNPNGSSHLHKIARELRTTPEYLTGEVDDPDLNAPPPAPPPTIHHVMMAVALPNQRALSRMFYTMLGLLDELPDNPDREERAELLAQWLPIGLSQLRDLLPDVPAPSLDGERELAEALATGSHGSRS